MTLKRQKGFTLIELLIVITIIGILSVALVPRLTGGQARARDAQRKADLQQIATALEFYADDSADGSYPTSTTAGCIDSGDLDAYLSTTPSDPKATDASTHSWDCDTDSGYTYYPLGSSGYVLGAVLENTQDKGQNVYEAGDPSGYADFSALDAAMTACSGGTCTAPVYFVGR